MSERRAVYVPGRPVPGSEPGVRIRYATIREACTLFQKYRRRGHRVVKSLFYAARETGLSEPALTAYLIQVGAEQLAGEPAESLRVLAGWLSAQEVALPTKRPLKEWKPK